MRVIVTTMIVVTFFIPWPTYGQQVSNSPDIGLHQAALQGNIEVVEHYIKSGTNLNEKDTYGSTPLIIAITFGRKKVAKALINAGADLEIPDKNGSTPLHLAAFFGHPGIVRELLDKNADRYARNNSGVTAYDIVAVPFDVDKNTYAQISSALSPLGFKLNYEQIKKARPQIVKMLRPSEDELKTIDYTPSKTGNWEVSTPDSQGLDPMLLSDLYLDASHLKTLYGLLVVKNGHLIGERYFNKGSIDQLSKRASVTKSFTSALIGIALHKGCLSGMDQKMIDFFPELSVKIKDPRKKQITIREMLEMRAGYPWEETDSTYWNAIWSGYYIPHIVEFPLINDPGTEFHYSNLTSHLLGVILARACKTDLKSFGQTNLFGPLGVTLGDWDKDLDGYYIGCADIQLTARNMAKFGQLYLNSGVYGGKQLVPSEWVKKSLQSYSENINSVGITAERLGRYIHNVGYGYQWWTGNAGNHHFEFAWGHGGQLIVILKDLDMVIVTTADPFYGKNEHWKSWKYEQGIINVIGKFISSLP